MITNHETEPLLSSREKHQGEPQPASQHEKTAGDHAPTDWDDLENTGRTTTDSRGQRTLGFRSRKTGKVHGYLDLMRDDMGEDSPMMDFFARMDALFCWFLFEHIESDRLRRIMQLINWPTYFAYLTYIMLRSGWDTFVAERKGELPYQQVGERSSFEPSDEKMVEDDNALSPTEDFIPQGYAILAPNGKQSLAFRESKTNKIITAMEINERKYKDDPILLAHERRKDQLMCRAMSACPEDHWLRTPRQVLDIPFSVALLWYSVLRTQWDLWLAGRGWPRDS